MMLHICVYVWCAVMNITPLRATDIHVYHQEYQYAGFTDFRGMLALQISGVDEHNCNLM